MTNLQILIISMALTCMVFNSIVQILDYIGDRRVRRHMMDLMAELELPEDPFDDYEEEEAK